MKRNNSDSHEPNKNGNALLDFCKTTSLRIVNGRVLGDLSGATTCLADRSDIDVLPSTIDYFLASASLFRDLEYCQVNDRTVHSIHSSVSVSLRISGIYRTKTSNTNLSFDHKTYKWESGDNLVYSSVLNSYNFFENMNDIDRTMDNPDADLDAIANSVTEVFITAADWN